MNNLHTIFQQSVLWNSVTHYSTNRLFLFVSFCLLGNKKMLLVNKKPVLNISKPSCTDTSSRPKGKPAKNRESVDYYYHTVINVAYFA